MSALSDFWLFSKVARIPVRVRLVVLFVALACLSKAIAAAASPPAAIDTVRQIIQGQGNASKATAWEAIRQVNDAGQRRDLARQLASMLKEPGLALEHKNFLGQLLAVVGGSEEVSVLAALLQDPATADTARIALEAIPGEASDQALRAAVPILRDQALVGLLHSLGVRHDAQAVPLLAPLLKSTNGVVVRAVLQALGEIGTAAAAQELDRAQPVLPAPCRVAGMDAQLACAGRLGSDGHPAEAADIYQRLATDAHPVPVRLGALRGLARTSPDQARPLLLAAMRAPDGELASGVVAISALLPDSETTRALVGELGRVPPETAVLVLMALGDRGDRLGLPGVLGHLNHEQLEVRVAAVSALGALGEAGHVDPLLALAQESQRPVAEAARESLNRISGPGVSDHLAERAGQGEPATRAVALRALAARGQPEARTMSIRALGDDQALVRLAALETLGRVAGAEDYPAVVIALAKTTAEKETLAALQAAEVAGQTLGDEARLAAIAQALANARGAQRGNLLRLAGRWGGARALALVRPELGSREPEARQSALQVLTEWPDDAAAADLFQQARSAPEARDRELAARGFFRVAELSPQHLATLLAQGAEIADTPERKRLWLGSLSHATEPGCLDLAVRALDDPAVRDEAALATLKISEALVKENPAAVKAAMARVAETTTQPDTIKKATALIRRAEAPVDVLSPLPYETSAMDGRVEAIRAQAGGDKLLAYLDCGAQAVAGSEGGPRLAQLTGQPWHYSGSESVAPGPFGTVSFDGQVLTFAVRDLNPQKKYSVGFTWWDYDANGRVQSLEIKSSGGPARRVIDKQALPSHVGALKPPAEFRVILEPADYAEGHATLRFLNNSGPNAVVSEVWLSETGADAKSGVTSRPAFEPKAKPPLDLDPPPDGIKVLLVTGIDYPGHPWQQTAPALQALLEKDPRLKVRTVEDPAALASPKIQLWDTVIIHFMDWETPGPGPEARENLRQFVSGGKGLALTHFACGAWDNNEWPEFPKLAGRAWDPKLRGHDPHGTFRVDIADPEHPITQGMQPFETLDELYTCLAGDTPIHVLAKATSKVDQKDYPMAFVLNYGQGRVFHCVLGHDARAYVSPGVGELLRRGIAWSAGKPPRP